MSKIWVLLKTFFLILNLKIDDQEYKKKGYKTLLAEDAPEIATFNYLKRGFDEPPTDYYLRPFGLAIKREIKDDCYLDVTEIEVNVNNLD